MAGDDFLKDLDKKEGGVPVWAYGAILAAGVVGYAFIKNRSSTSATAAGSSTTPGSSPDSYPPDGTTGNPSDLYSTDPATNITYGDEQSGGAQIGQESGAYYDYAGEPIVISAGGVQPYSQAPPSPATNTQWERAVVDWLQSKGLTGGEASDAVNDYLDGQTLDSSERASIDLAEDFWGSPPQGVPAVTSGSSTSSSSSSSSSSNDSGGDVDTGDDDTSPANPGLKSGPVHRKTPAKKTDKAVSEKTAAGKSKVDAHRRRR
jgi:hypothetical protein